jgi:hypothetical protein
VFLSRGRQQHLLWVISSRRPPGVRSLLGIAAGMAWEPPKDCLEQCPAPITDVARHVRCLQNDAVRRGCGSSWIVSPRDSVRVFGQTAAQTGMSRRIYGINWRLHERALVSLKRADQAVWVLRLGSGVRRRTGHRCQRGKPAQAAAVPPTSVTTIENVRRAKPQRTFRGTTIGRAVPCSAMGMGPISGPAKDPLRRSPLRAARKPKSWANWRSHECVNAGRCTTSDSIHRS